MKPHSHKIEVLVAVVPECATPAEREAKFVSQLRSDRAYLPDWAILIEPRCCSGRHEHVDLLIRNHLVSSQDANINLPEFPAYDNFPLI